MTEPDQRVRRIADTVLLAAFAAALVLPAGGLLRARAPEQPAAESRTQGPPPTVIARLKTVAENHFGGRMALVRAHSLVNLRWFHISPTPRVLVGSDGWLFYSDESEVECARRSKPMSDAELGAWLRALESRRALLASRGIRYLVLFAPDKHTLYPEYLPRSLQAGPGPSRLDQLIEAVRTRTQVQLLDLRPALQAGKASADLYYHLDTHWNQRAALLAAQQIGIALLRWYPALHPLELSDYAIDVAPAYPGDLISFAGLERVVKEWHEEFTPRFASPAKVEILATSRYRVDVVRSTRPSAAIASALVLRDSFGTALVPFLAQYFRRAVHLWSYQIPLDKLDQEKPEVVIQQIVERRLMAPPRE